MLELFDPHSLVFALAAFAALAGTFLAYGLTELVGGYGFLAEQTEQLLMIALVVLLGGAIAGGILDPLTWPAAIAFFGIRGIGSISYLAYALNAAAFSQRDLLWALVAFTILVSIVVHGTTATLVTRRLDSGRQRGGKPEPTTARR